MRESAGCGVEESFVTHKPSQLLVFLFLNTRTPPPPPPNLKYLSVLHPCSQLTQIVCYTANIQRLINICEEVCCSGLQLVLYHYAHSPFAVQLVQYIWPCVLYKIINLNTGLHLHQEVNTVWIMKKKRKVFITTEWLPWLQTN